MRDLSGAHPFDGASVSNIVPGAADDLGVEVQQGVVLLAVRPNSTAARLGFRTGDVVVQVGRDRIANVSQLEGVLQVRQRSWLVLVRRGNQVLRLQLGRLAHIFAPSLCDIPARGASAVRENRGTRMARFFAWIVDRLRWLLLAAVGVGAVLVYIGWSDAARIRDVRDQRHRDGRPHRRRDAHQGPPQRRELFAEARVARQQGRHADPRERSTVSNAFARQIIRNDRVMRDAVRIKYLPDATIDSVPIVLEDAARQEEQDELMMKFGFGLAGVGAVGSGLFFLLGRRRNRPSPGSTGHT